jgi:ferredoxin-NADP reductase
MRLAEQKFSYVPNTSFRGPEHLWVEWDPKRNPEQANPDVRHAYTPVRIGEPSTHSISRPVVVERVTTVAQGIVKLRLVEPHGGAMPRWAPGSHIDVECGDTGLSRQYSLCSDPAERQALEVCVLQEAQSRGGSSWIHANVKAGDRLRIRGPRNHFRLDESVTKAVFVAGGIGITPVSAMARRAKSLGMDYELHYSGRSRHTMALIDELIELHGDRLHIYADDEGTRNDLSTLHPEPGTQVYACGPKRMLEALQVYSEKWPADSLRIEHFESTIGTLDASKDHAFDVELKDSGVVLTVAANQTLLSALRSANIDVQSDCEEGLCGSCEVRVLAGEVDHRDVVLTRSERNTHSRIMTCCSRAAGKKLVLEL